MLHVLGFILGAACIAAYGQYQQLSAADEHLEFNSEQTRQIATTMKNFFDTELEKVTVCIQGSPITEEFFAHKKGKRYKLNIKKEKCSLSKINRFIESLEEDISEYSKFLTAIPTTEVNEGKNQNTVFEYEDDNPKTIKFFERKIQKLTEVITVLKEKRKSAKEIFRSKISNPENAWEFFLSNTPGGFLNFPVNALKSKFLEHLHEMYGIGSLN